MSATAKVVAIFYLNIRLTFTTLHFMTDRVCYVYVGLYLCILYGASEPGMGMISR